MSDTYERRIGNIVTRYGAAHAVQPVLIEAIAKAWDEEIDRLRAKLAKERERCAKIAEEVATAADGDGELYIARRIADRIRSPIVGSMED